MNEEFLYYKVLDIICDKRASYFNWSYFDDNIYCYSLINEIFNDSSDFLSQEMTLFSVINDFLIYRIPFVINLTTDQYYDLGLLTYFLNINEDVFFVKDPFNEFRFFILFSDDVFIDNSCLTFYDDSYDDGYDSLFFSFDDMMFNDFQNSEYFDLDDYELVYYDDYIDEYNYDLSLT